MTVVDRETGGSNERAEEREMHETDQLTIRQTPTGYWSVQRGATHITGAISRKGAEAERDLLSRLETRRPMRTRRRPARGPRPIR